MTIVPFRPRTPKGPQSPVPPMFNIPPLTLYAMIVMVVVHVAFTVMSQELRAEWGYRLAFVPIRYTDPTQFDWTAAIAPFTHMFLHGGWMHIMMNSLMLLAFGAGAERMLGPKRTALLFVLCGLTGAATQFAIAPFSPVPMIGASGALSGLFAALTVRLQQSGMMPAGRFGIWGIAALWIGLSLAMGFIGGSIGVGDVAWAAHAGGFIAGVLLMRVRYFN